MFGQLFSGLASENTELLASLASVLKNLSTPLSQPLPLIVEMEYLYLPRLQLSAL
jgi:hypothetical protein